jgi:hypothetical protein
MAALKKMPQLIVDQPMLKEWGDIWLGEIATQPRPKRARTRGHGADSVPALVTPSELKAKRPEYFDKTQGMQFGYVFDRAFGAALAELLGGIPVVTPKAGALIPPQADCVEVGATRIVGAIRPQNYDAAYRPDGPRIVYDSKTLNDTQSVRKNWQNMVNDLTAEASTVHIRFPMCIVAFIVAIPSPALPKNQERDIIRTLERLGSREDELDQHNLSEAVALVVWHPADGTIDPNIPPSGSNLRLETINERIAAAYMDRYKNLPPHQESDDEGPDEDSDALPAV